jgi:Uma2 family endonuclease
MRTEFEKVTKAVILRPPLGLLEGRRRSGADRWDEMWQGVLHMVPPPSSWHQRFGTKLVRVLAPLAEAKGLEAAYETGLFRPGVGESDYRVPDLVFARDEQIAARGVEGRAELVVELLSEADESREKLDFYAAVEVCEVLLIDPETRDCELYALRGGRLHVALPDERGAVRSQVLGASFEKAPGPQLRIQWPGGEARI